MKSERDNRCANVEPTGEVKDGFGSNARGYVADRIAGLVLLLLIIGSGTLIGRRAGWPRGETLFLTVAAWVLVGVWARPRFFWESRKIAWARDTLGDNGTSLFYTVCAAGLILAAILLREHLDF